MIRRSLTCVVFAFVALVSLRGARAWCSSTTLSSLGFGGSSCGACVVDGVPLAWARRCISLSIDARNSALVALSAPSIRSIVERSFDRWTSADCGVEAVGLAIELTEPSACRVAEFNERGGNVNTVAFLDDWTTHDPPLSEAALALTMVWFDTATGEILDADMLLNPTLGPFAECPETGCVETNGIVAVDLESVITHEAGHFFGLAHSDEPSATMGCTSQRGATANRGLEADDVAAVCEKYGAVASTSSCDAAPPTGLDLDCEDDVGVAPSASGCSLSNRARSGVGFGPVTACLVVAFAWRRRSDRRASLSHRTSLECSTETVEARVRTRGDRP